MAKGPLGNSPRDEKDSFVGAPAEDLKTGAPPRWPPNPKKMVKPKDTFHSKVVGSTSMPRADRPGHFRRGGFVRPPK